MEVSLGLDQGGKWLACVRVNQSGVVNWTCQRFVERSEALDWIMRQIDSAL